VEWGEQEKHDTRSFDLTLHPPPSALRFRAGFSLVEATVASVVLAVATVGVVSMVNASYAHAAALRDEATAIGLARQLLAEVAAKPWRSGATTAGGWSDGAKVRSLYDDVQDFNGYTDSTADLKTAGGATVAITGGGPFTRTVTLASSPAMSGVPVVSDFAVVTVTVTTGRGHVYTLSRLASKYDPPDRNG
jgi:hypothetical protein